MKASQDRAKFSIIVEFVEKQVKMASDPVFGEIQDKQGPGKSKCQASKTIRGNSFATQRRITVHHYRKETVLHLSPEENVCSVQISIHFKAVLF